MPTFQQGGGFLVEAYLPQQRQDDRRAGDHQDRAEYDGHGPAQPADVMSGEASEQPCQRGAEQGEPDDARSGAPEFAELEVHASLEHDDGHTQPDEPDYLRLWQAQLDDARHRAQHKTGGDQDHDGRHADAPGRPMAGKPCAQQHQKQGRGAPSSPSRLPEL